MAQLITSSHSYHCLKLFFSYLLHKFIFNFFLLTLFIIHFSSYYFSKTYNVDKQVPDSAATATAMFSGVKCRFKVLGLDSRAIFQQCDKNVNKLSRLSTFAEWAQAAGKDTGAFIFLYIQKYKFTLDDINIDRNHRKCKYLFPSIFT